MQNICGDLNMCVKIKAPSKCDDKELLDFHRLVLKGEQVQAAGLKYRIRRAVLLAFYYERDTLVGVAALKRPNRAYKDEVFRKAGVFEKRDELDFELGWAFTLEKYRGKGICSCLVRKLLEESEPKNLFATTRKDNLQMQKILKQNGFRRVGKSYVGRSCSLLLFIRTYG